MRETPDTARNQFGDRVRGVSIGRIGSNGLFSVFDQVSPGERCESAASMAGVRERGGRKLSSVTVGGERSIVLKVFCINWMWKNNLRHGIR